MIRYIIRRLFMMIPILIGVILIVFILNEITPGDPARSLAGDSTNVQDIERIRVELGLDKPVTERFINYLIGIVTRGDLGISYATKQPVAKEVVARFPTTFLLTLVSVSIMVGMGVPLGIFSAIRKYTWIDNLTQLIGLAGVSMPNFWQGLMNILIFSIYFKWLPASGFYGWKYWILPAITIGTSTSAQVMRMTRSSMLDVICQDYIRAAKAKGLSEGTIIRKHALKNALIPILTVVGMDFGKSMGGAVLTETVFAIPGLGRYMIEAIKSRNYPVVQGGVLIFAFSFSIVTLIVDILYVYIDPRLRTLYGNTSKVKFKGVHNKDIKEMI